MPLPRGQSYLLAWLFAADRMDTWVLKVSIAIPLVCIAGLGLWHLMVFLAGKLPTDLLICEEFGSTDVGGIYLQR